MSSNLLLKKVCKHCGNIFTAKTTVTKFCSDDCAKKNYKLRKKQEAVNLSNDQTKSTILKGNKEGNVGSVSDQQEIVDIKVLSAVTSISERTLYRLVKDPSFPKIKIGRSVLFHKKTVIQFIISKYGSI